MLFDNHGFSPPFSGLQNLSFASMDYNFLIHERNHDFKTNVWNREEQFMLKSLSSSTRRISSFHDIWAFSQNQLVFHFCHIFVLLPFWHCPKLLRLMQRLPKVYPLLYWNCPSAQKVTPQRRKRQLYTSRIITNVFRKIIYKVCSSPIVEPLKPNLLCSVDTDTCAHSIGYTLFQTHNNGKQKPIGY